MVTGAYDYPINLGNDQHRGTVVFPNAKNKDQFKGYTRREARRISQWAAWHIPPARKATRDLARFCGAVRLDAATDDEEFNAAHAAWWEETYERRPGNYDISGKFTCATFKENALFGVFRDGDLGIAHVTGPGGEPLVMAIESALIDGQPADASADWCDGVRVGPQNQHLAYHIINDTTGKGTVIDAADFYLFANYETHSSVRGSPSLIHALPRVRDLREIDNAAVKAAKIQGLVAFYLKRELGATSEPIGTFSGKVRKDNLAGVGTQTTANTAAPSNVPRRVNEVFDDAEMADFPAGITPGVLNDGRDFSAQTVLKEDIYRQIAWGLGVHESVLFGLEKLTGPGVRYVLQQAQEWRYKWLDLQLKFSVVDYVRRTEWAIRTRQLRAPKDSRWWRHTVNYPRAITIDVGRDANAQEKRLTNALTTRQREYAEEGDQWKPHAKQWLAEKVYLKTEGEKMGLTPAEIFPDTAPPPAAEKQTTASTLESLATQITEIKELFAELTTAKP